jgi:hypothetical protein
MLHVQPMLVFLIELPLQHYASSKNCKLLITKLYNYIYCSLATNFGLFDHHQEKCQLLHHSRNPPINWYEPMGQNWDLF